MSSRPARDTKWDPARKQRKRAGENSSISLFPFPLSISPCTLLGKTPQLFILPTKFPESGFEHFKTWCYRTRVSVSFVSCRLILDVCHWQTGQLAGASSLLPPCGPWEWNSGAQAHQRVFLTRWAVLPALDSDLLLASPHDLFLFSNITLSMACLHRVDDVLLSLLSYYPSLSVIICPRSIMIVHHFFFID